MALITLRLQIRDPIPGQAADDVHEALNVDKYEISTSEVVFLGHIVTSEGFLPDPKKTEAIMEMKEPKNVGGLRSFLSMINQLGRFIPQLAEKDKPLRDLLFRKNCWVWGVDQTVAFNSLKRALTSPPVLAIHDPNRDTKCWPMPHRMGWG